MVTNERSPRSVADKLEGDSEEPMVYVPDWIGSQNKMNTLTQKQTEKVKSLLFSFDSVQFFSGLDEFYPHQEEESILLCPFIQMLVLSRRHRIKFNQIFGYPVPRSNWNMLLSITVNWGQVPKLAAREAGNVGIWPFKCTQQWDIFFFCHKTRASKNLQKIN